MSKIMFSNGRMKSNSFCLNAMIVPEFLILGSRWNHFSSAVEKKIRSKILCLTIVTWNINISWVCLCFRIRLFRYYSAWFFIFLNMQHKLLRHLLNFSDSKPNSIKLFSIDVPCIAPVMASAALYWTDPSFLQKDSLEDWS